MRNGGLVEYYSTYSIYLSIFILSFIINPIYPNLTSFSQWYGGGTEVVWRWLGGGTEVVGGGWEVFGGG